MNCLLCDEHIDTDMLDHVRLIHPATLDQKTNNEILSLSPVNQSMHDQDWVCESCDRQFRLGMVYGEQIEGMFNGLPVVSLVCGECFWKVE
jgi:hypothetical protein